MNRSVVALMLIAGAVMVHTRAAPISLETLSEELKMLRQKNDRLELELRDQKNEVKALKQTIEQSETTVGFSAFLTETTLITEGSILIFDNIVTNVGDAYEVITGTFTAPESGLYTFTLFFLATESTGLEIRVNDVVMCRGYGYETPPGNTGTCTLVVELTVGDLVNVKLRDNNDDITGEVYGSQYSGFSGVLQHMST